METQTGYGEQTVHAVQYGETGYSSTHVHDMTRVCVCRMVCRYVHRVVCACLTMWCRCGVCGIVVDRSWSILGRGAGRGGGAGAGGPWRRSRDRTRNGPQAVEAMKRDRSEHQVSTPGPADARRGEVHGSAVQRGVIVILYVTYGA